MTGARLKRRPDGRNKRVLIVQCDCGATKEVYPANLASGDTRSCGCLQRKRASDANTKHGGKSKSASTEKKRLLSIWRGMRSRCHNPNSSNFKWYGGKGIGIDWVDFESFYTWSINHGYTEGLEIDRINPSLNYSEHNCIWSTKGDNIARAHLNIDLNIKTQATLHAKETGSAFHQVVENALRVYLDGRKEV